MGDYVTTTQVAGTIPQWEQDRWPDALDSDLEIAGIEGEVNSLLSARGIVTPFVSDSSDSQDAFADFLTLIVRNGVAWRIVRASFPQQASAGADSAWHDYMTVYKDGLAGIKDGSALPQSIVNAEDDVGPATTGVTYSDSVVNDSLGSENQAHFTRDRARRY